MAFSRALTTASGFMKLLRSHHSPQQPTPVNARSLRTVAFLKSGSETNSGSKSDALTTATGLVKLFRSHHSPQMLTPFSACSLRTVAFPTSISKANSDSESEALTIVTGLVKLLHSQLSPQMATSFTDRSLRTVALPTSGSDTDSDSDYESDADTSSKRCYILKDCPLANRFLRGGSKLAYDVKEDEEAKYARVDMPGIGKEAVKVWAEKSALIIEGDESSDEETARSYFGAIELAEGRYMVDQIKAELKNGVLKVVIPKVKFEDRNDVFLVKVE